VAKVKLVDCTNDQRIKAFQEIQKGEQQAAALEAHLDSLESKLDEILAQAEADHSRIITEKGKNDA